MRILLISCCLIFSLSSCTNTPAKVQETHVKVLKMSVFAPFNPFKVREPVATKYSIISYLNVSCPPCLDEIKKWEKFNTKYNTGNFQIKLICYAEDDFEYFKYLCRKKMIERFPYPFMLDTANNFADQNKILKEHDVDKTVLIDSDMQILLTGNPLKNDKILATYLTKLK